MKLAIVCLLLSLQVFYAFSQGFVPPTGPTAGAFAGQPVFPNTMAVPQPQSTDQQQQATGQQPQPTNQPTVVAVDPNTSILTNIARRIPPQQQNQIDPLFFLFALGDFW